MNGDARLREIVALSTLPAIWLNAEPLRVAESLAAALFTPIGAELVCVGLNDDGAREPIVVAQVGRGEQDRAVAHALGPSLLAWARTHDPDEMMPAPNPLSSGELYLATRPIGLEAEFGVVAAGFRRNVTPDPFQLLLLNVAATQATVAVQNFRLLRSLRLSVLDRERSEAGERRAREEVEALQGVSHSLAAELDINNLMQLATDAAARLSGARFGAFFYNITDERGEVYQLYTLSGASRQAFERFGSPRNTKLFDHTFRGLGVLRLDDVLADPRYGHSAPHYGMPKGHLPVRSYLAVPVMSRSGGVLGGLFMGHPEPGVFTEGAERLLAGIAAQAAVAIDNARLFQEAQTEIASRKRHEARQRLLLDELNHRVKNTLATVQSIASRTLQGDAPIAEERRAFQARLAALSKTHELLSSENWEGVDLNDVVLGALIPYGGGEARFSIAGPRLRLSPKAALTCGMAIHELATNAAKYGALSNASGRVAVQWRVDRVSEPGRLHLQWTEAGGPPVGEPRRRGFGSLMIERALQHDLDGNVRLSFLPEGVVCTIDFSLPTTESRTPER